MNYPQTPYQPPGEDGQEELREAAIKTAQAAVPSEIEEPLRAELVSTLASLLAIGVVQERRSRGPEPPSSPEPLRAVPDAEGPGA